MTIIISILWFLIFNKLLFFWLWLWQLKEYHLGRFKAHFETQKLKKIVSCLWRPKFPKPTKKALAIIFYGLLLEASILIRFPLWLAIISMPLVIALSFLFFESIAHILKNKILEKAKQKREQFKNLLVIGITGSYGKTSTKEFLATILADKFHPVKSCEAGAKQFNRVKVLKTKKHINAEIGIAQTILKELKPEHEIFIAEIGAYKRGKIREVCQILQPKIGILTGINEQHMSTFGSQENIIKAKYELIESLPPDGLAVFNGNNKYCRDLYQKTAVAKKLIQAPADGFMAENVLMAQSTAEALGMNPEEIARASEKIKSPIQIKKGINGLNIIDSTYSANPDGVIAHLEYLKTLPGRKIIVMPCLIELGQAARQIHQRIGESIAQICDLAIITTQDYFEEIKKAAIANGMPEENILFLKKSNQILEKIQTSTNSGDVVLLESRMSPKLINLLWK